MFLGYPPFLYILVFSLIWSIIKLFSAWSLFILKTLVRDVFHYVSWQLKFPLHWSPNKIDIKSPHLSPVLHKLHWNPVSDYIQYKILPITYKSLHGLAPSCTPPFLYSCTKLLLYPRFSLTYLFFSCALLKFNSYPLNYFQENFYYTYTFFHFSKKKKQNKNILLLTFLLAFQSSTNLLKGSFSSIQLMNACWTLSLVSSHSTFSHFTLATNKEKKLSRI